MHAKVITLNLHRHFAEIHTEYNAHCIVVSSMYNLDQVPQGDIVAVMT